MPLSPQGLIQENGSSEMFTLKAKPWKVMPRRTAIPTLPNLLLLTHNGLVSRSGPSQDFPGQNAALLGFLPVLGCHAL